jgi:hypothetical protein
MAQITVGGENVCGVDMQGRITCWGLNNFGQNSVPSGLENVLANDVLKPTTEPTISGIAKVGSNLTAQEGSWISGSRLWYQWLRNGAEIPGATSSNYYLSSVDFGQPISIRITALKNGHISRNVTSQQIVITAGTIAAARLLKLSGKPIVGKELMVTTGFWESGVTVTCQWLRNGAVISKATSAKYKLTALDKGKKISVKVTGKKYGYQTLTRISTPLTIK